MADSPELFTTITNFISFNPIHHMVVTFILFPLHRQAQYKDNERKMGHTTTNKF